MSSVAIIIPCHSHSAWLSRAIDSALSQTVPAEEIIVVDDGSPDDLRPVVAEYPAVILVRQPNRGLAAARNAGLRTARSGKVIFLDADDYLHPSAVEAGLRCFEDNEGVAFAYGAHQVLSGDSTLISYKPAIERSDFVRFNVVGMIAAVLFDRERLLGIDGFDEALGMAEDWDLYLRLTRRCAFATHPEVVATYVHHAGNMSADVAQLLHWVKIVRQRERQRGLDAREERAWQEGRDAWAYLDDTADTRSMLRRVRRKAARLVRNWR